MKVMVGLVYDEDTDTYYTGITDDPENGYDEGVLELELTDEQAEAARAGARERNTALAKALALREEADRQFAEAEATYKEKFGWLADRLRAAEIAQEEAERAEDARKRQEWLDEIAAKLAAEDAELGPRDFVWVRMTDNALSKFDQDKAREEESAEHYGRGQLSDKYKVIHLRDCKSLEAARNSDVRNPNGAYAVAQNAKDLRLGPAVTMYLMGAKTCGVCKPDELLVQAEEGGELARAERLKREALPVQIPVAALKKAVTEIGLAWSKYGNDGFSDATSDSIKTGPTERIVGWHHRGDRYISAIPEHAREEIFEHLSGKFGWTVRWSGADRPGYLIIGQLTAAQKRELREAK